MTANDSRGETSLSLEGVDYVLRPSYAACKEIESRLGRSLVELTAAAERQALSLDDLSVIAECMVRAWGNAPDGDETPERRTAKSVKADRLGELMFVEGLPRSQMRIYVALAEAVTGGVDASGKKKPVTETTRPTATGD
jgi:hypothetical protein